MTSKLTREQATDSELQMLIDSHEKGTAMFLRVDAYYLMAVELQERRKAAMGSGPVAWTDDEELRDAKEGGCGYLFGVDRDANKFADPRRQIMLYRHAQPAPVVPDENTLRIQGIEALEEFLTATTPEPEMVGGIKLAMTCCRVFKSIIKNNGWADFNGGNPEEVKAETIISALREPHSDDCNACRAAMLQAGNSPVHGESRCGNSPINDVTAGKPFTILLPDISSKAFWSGAGKNETFHPETYRRWAKEAIERYCAIARIDVEVK